MFSGWRDILWLTRIFRKHFTGSLLMSNTSTTQNARTSNRTDKACKNILKLRLTLGSRTKTLVDLTKEKQISTKFSSSLVKDIIPMWTKLSNTSRTCSSMQVTWTRTSMISSSCQVPTVLALRSEVTQRLRQISRTKEPTRTLINLIKFSYAKFSN